MITREQLLTPGARFRAESDGGSYKAGDVLVFLEDDGSDSAFFKRESDAREVCAFMHRLDLIDPDEPAVAAAPAPEPQQDALTLRDQFAMAALISIGDWCPSSSDEFAGLKDASTLARRAVWAYKQADAMLTARAKVRT